MRICTGDRDALQLVSDQVTVLYPQRGVSEMTRFTPEAVEAKYGLTPLQYPDFAALRGDPSDNLPGIPGVGEKTATKWIREFGSLPPWSTGWTRSRGKAGDALRETLPHVLINRRLTELVREVPVDADPADRCPAPYDREAVHRIFDDLQFRVLRERLLETSRQARDQHRGLRGRAAAARPGHGPGLAGRARHRPGRAGGPRHLGARGRRRAHHSPSRPPTARRRGRRRRRRPDDEAALAAWFADPTPTKVGHDLKAAIRRSTARGWPVDGVACDTALAAYLALPGQHTFDLGDLVQRYLHRTLTRHRTTPSSNSSR